jgi:hypothetical protein
MERLGMDLFDKKQEGVDDSGQILARNPQPLTRAQTQSQ